MPSTNRDESEHSADRELVLNINRHSLIPDVLLFLCVYFSFVPSTDASPMFLEEEVNNQSLLTFAICNN